MTIKERSTTEVQPHAELTDVRTLCAKLGIELQGEQGHPFHCGQRMKTYSGIMGTDLAICEVCGLTIGNIASPHINGGFLMGDEWHKKHGDRTWARLSDRKVVAHTVRKLSKEASGHA